ncbi:MAG: acyloxyacyl hydrolase [Nitrospirae bacterium]|nr:acyloxyacyl hydrolase [Nitrospirota bacterium]
MCVHPAAPRPPLRRFWAGLLALALAVAVPGAALANHPSAPHHDHDHYGVFWAGHLAGPDDDFAELQGFAKWPLPWHGTRKDGWHWESALWATAGPVSVNGDQGWMVGAGPLLRLLTPGTRFYGSLGIRPVILSRERFGNLDLGYRLEFISHAGGGVYLTERLSVGYRIQHISNAGLSDTNPGINLFIIQAGWNL